MLLVYTALITAATKKGLGKHVQDISSSTNLTIALKLTYIGEFLSIIACVLSKTSFAVSLLRVVVDRWQVVLLWFIIFSMNSLMWLTAILTLAQCQPSAKLWDFQIKAKCWNPSIVSKFAIVAGGELSIKICFGPAASANGIESIFRCHGSRTRFTTMVYCLEITHDGEGENWNRAGHELGYIVSYFPILKIRIPRMDRE